MEADSIAPGNYSITARVTNSEDDNGEHRSAATVDDFVKHGDSGKFLLRVTFSI